MMASALNAWLNPFATEVAFGVTRSSVTVAFVTVTSEVSSTIEPSLLMPFAVIVTCPVETLVNKP